MYRSEETKEVTHTHIHTHTRAQRVVTPDDGVVV